MARCVVLTRTFLSHVRSKFQRFLHLLIDKVISNFEEDFGFISKLNTMSQFLLKLAQITNNPNLIDEKIVTFKITLHPLSKLKTSSDNVVISTTITTERIAKF